MFGFNFSNPEQMVSDAATKVAGGVGNSFMNFIKAPFNGLAGMGQGIIGNLGGLLWGGIVNTAIIIGAKLFTPALWAAGERAILGEEGAKKSAERMAETKETGLLLDSAALGFGSAAAMSAAKGAIGSGGLLGGGLVLGTVAAVTIGALHKGDVKVAQADSASKQPPATPPATSPEKPAQAKG